MAVKETKTGFLSLRFRLLQAELPAELDFGQHICGDTKQILAWAKEIKTKAYMKRPDRYDKDRQPKAGKDCKLDCKKRSNQSQIPLTDGVPARTVSVGEYYWGYASGIIATNQCSGRLGPTVPRPSGHTSPKTNGTVR